MLVIQMDLVKTARWITNLLEVRMYTALILVADCFNL